MASILSPAPLDPPLLTNSRAIWAREYDFILKQISQPT